MNATAIETNGKPTSAVEYVHGLSPEEKEAVFLLLLKELIAINEGDTHPIPIGDPDGKVFGYYVSAAAMWPSLGEPLPPPSPEVEAELERRAREPGIPAAEVVADLKARLAALQR